MVPIKDNWDGSERRQETLASQALVAQLAILNERLGNMIDTFGKHVAADEKKFEAQDVRITKLENWHMKVVGGLAVLSILIQLVFNVHWKAAYQQNINPIVQSAQAQQTGGNQ